MALWRKMIIDRKRQEMKSKVLSPLYLRTIFGPKHHSRNNAIAQYWQEHNGLQIPTPLQHLSITEFNTSLLPQLAHLFLRFRFR
jgi:hypothetical protein